MGSMSEMLAEVAAAGTTVLFSSHQLDLVEDICEDVVIINAAGSCGPVTSPSCGPSTAASCDHSLPQVRTGLVPIVRGRGRRPARRARLRVEQGADLAAMLAAAQRDTDLVSFAYEPPTLSELFREAVAA